MAVSHDQNFKNLILDYPRAALEFFAPAEAPAPEDAVRFLPARQEQLKTRLGMGFRALDTPLLVEWEDGRREAVVFALEEESDWRRFSPRRLARYCLDIADLYDTNRVVPVVIFLRRSRGAPSSVALGTERNRYLTFRYISCKLAEEPVNRWWNSRNVVARVNLPNMRGAAGRRVLTYGQAVRGLLELEPASVRREKYLEFIDIYAALTDNEFEQYERQYPKESSTMAGITGVIERARDEGHAEGHTEGRMEGRAEGERLVLERLLRRRFGVVAPGVAERLGRASEGELAAWAENVLDAETVDEVFEPMR